MALDDVEAIYPLSHAQRTMVQPEHDRMLLAGNDTRTAYAEDATIERLFEAQVERSADVAAVGFQAQHLTYGELNRRANQVAHHLRLFGVGPEARVGICMERSPEMVIGILGVLKAGAAFLPLDPSYPIERLAYMLEHSQAAVLLSQEKLLEALPSSWARAVCMDSDWEIIAQQSAENPTSGALADNIAYVIYTSGSTGRPKGVMVSHRGVGNLAEAQSVAFQIGPGSRVLQFASLSFDASVSEIFVTLLKGGGLWLGTQEELQPGGPLVDLLRNEEITTVTLPPAVLAVLACEELPALRTIVAAGEACSAAIVEKWSEGRRFINAYGPTETTVCATLAQCEKGGGRPAIGRPINNTRVYTLDERIELVPIGEAGELCVAGVGLARGYLGQPDLTAERFVPDQFSNPGGERLYRTGDLCKYLEGGEVDYAGRIDHQAKVRGFRIEPGEIEEVLTQHWSVREAVVLVDDSAEEKRLLAYIVPAQKSEASAKSLRQHLNKLLPAFMVPAAFVMLDAIPLTLSGKTDRRALLSSNPIGQAEETYVAPCTELEEILAGIWSKVLRIERPGVTDDFLELGGHSLSATQMISLIQSAFGIEISLRTLLEAPTISELALRIESGQRTSRNAVSLEITEAPRDEGLPLSYTQQRIWLSAQLHPDAASWNLPLALRIKGPLDLNALEQALNEIVRRQHSLRTVIEVSNDRPVQRISSPMRIPFQMADLEGLDAGVKEAEAMRLGQLETQRPFELSKAPLLRVRHLRLGDSDCLLVIIFHHITFDAWSRDVIQNELLVLYRSFVRGEPSALPELRLQYIDFACSQRHWTERGLLDDQRTYWRKQLSAAPAPVDLVGGKPRSGSPSLQGEVYPWSLPAWAAEFLKSLAKDEAATLFMAILALFNVFLLRQTGSTDIVIGTDLANRSRAGTGSIIGFFVNAVALYTKLSGELSFRQVLRRVRETALAAYASQDLPFDEVLKELPQDLARAQLFNAFLLFQNHGAGDFALDGVEVSRVGFKSGIALCDLSLFVMDTPGGIACTWNYKTDVFDRRTIERWTDSFRTLAAAIRNNPDLPLDELEIFSAEEKQRRATERSQREEKSFKRFKTIRRKSIA